MKTREKKKKVLNYKESLSDKRKKKNEKICNKNKFKDIACVTLIAVTHNIHVASANVIIPKP